MSRRYCGMCDKWVKGAKECPACGADTMAAAAPVKKQPQKAVDLMDALRRALPKPVAPTHEGRADAYRMEMCRLASWSGTPGAVADALLAAVEADNRRLEAMSAVRQHTCHDMNPPQLGPCVACEDERVVYQRAQRDDLLVALKAIVAMYGPSTEYDFKAREAWAACERAIAKAES